MHYAFAADPDALVALFDRMRGGGPIDDLHAASHPAWLARAERLEASLAELIDVDAARAHLSEVEPWDAAQAEVLARAGVLLDRTAVLHLWTDDRDVLVNQLARIARLVELGAPPMLIDNDRLMLATRLSQAEERTHDAPPATPIRLFIEALTGQAMSLHLPWFIDFPPGGVPALDDLGQAPGMAQGGWTFLDDAEVVHSALLRQPEVRDWADAVEQQPLRPSAVAAQALDWLRVNQPDADLAGREDEGAAQLRAFMRDDLRFLARRLRDVAAEGHAVFSWSVKVVAGS